MAKKRARTIRRLSRQRFIKKLANLISKAPLLCNLDKAIDEAKELAMLDFTEKLKEAERAIARLVEKTPHQTKRVEWVYDDMGMSSYDAYEKK